MDKCENCGEELTDVEQKAKDEEKADAWCCYECFGDGSIEQFSTYGKYHVLLRFVKDLAYPKDDDPAWIGKKHFEKVARELLKEIGEEDGTNK